MGFPSSFWLGLGLLELGLQAEILLSWRRASQDAKGRFQSTRTGFVVSPWRFSGAQVVQLILWSKQIREAVFDKASRRTPKIHTSISGLEQMEIIRTRNPGLNSTTR